MILFQTFFFLPFRTYNSSAEQNYLNFILHRFLSHYYMSSTTTPIAIDDFVLAIKDLSDENITSVKSQLLNSILKLTESNELLETEISTTKEAIAQLNPDQSHQSLAEDLELYQESIEENKIVITSQRERVTALDAEMTSRGLLSQKQEEQTKSDEIYL